MNWFASARVRHCTMNKNCKSFIYAESMNNLGCIKGPKLHALKPHNSVTAYDKDGIR